MKYVEKGFKTDNRADIEACEISNIIGSNSFKEHIIKKYLMRNVSDIDKREQPILAKVNAYTVDYIIEQIADYYKIKNIDKITVRRGGNLEARKLAMFITGKQCQCKETLNHIAEKFNVSISGLNMARSRFSVCLKTDVSLQEKVKSIDKKLKDKRNN